MEGLPGDILTDIPTRLPLKPLGQLRCVSKHLNHFLSHPSFIRSRMNRYINNNDEIILLLIHGTDLEDCFIEAYFSRLLGLDNDLIPNFITLPPSIPESQYNTLKFFGCVNGLICINYRPFEHELVRDWIMPDNTASVFLIWNPSLSAVSTLPECTLPFRNLEDSKPDVRFGHDSQNNDYKIVKVIGNGISGECFANHWMQVEVYSMRRGHWALISERFPPHVIEIFNPDRCCADGYNGHLHWIGTIKLGEKLVQTIVSFDLAEERFSEIRLPPYPSERSWDSLGVLEGNLCLMSLTGGGDRCEVWVMTEYRNANSWVRNHIISDLSGIKYPYGFTLSNEFLYATPEHTFHLYDPITTDIKAVDSDHPDFKFARYVESLAWIAPPRQD